ncbi:MAG: PIN domain-containing protein [Alistipes sp.]|nr:PIN domain-containing protein [Alistipes sp.]
MKDRIFVDSNIFIYLYSTDEPEKQNISNKMIDKYPCIISTQVLNEFCNVCLKKFNKSVEEIELALIEINANCDVTLIDNNTIKQALEIRKIYGYSYYDCLIVASALQSDCKYLITEDMADGQMINKKLRIINIYSNNNVVKYFDI